MRASDPRTGRKASINGKGAQIKKTLEKHVVMRTHRTDISNSCVNLHFCVAGFRPGSRGPFVSAKGPKTNDAPSGLIRMGRTPVLGRRPNSLRSNKVRQFIRASDPRTGRKASINGEETQTKKPLAIDWILYENKW